MRDVDARHAARLEPSDQLIQPIRLDLAQAARRLVEHDDARASADGDGDLHDLLLRDRQLAQPARDVDVRADLGEHRGGAPATCSAIHEPARDWQRAEAEILGDDQVVAERELLVHHADAGRERVARTAEVHLAVADEQLALVRRV